MATTGWWSSSGKEEPETGDYRTEKAVNAVHVKPNNEIFYRNKEFSVSGTIYHGTWIKGDIPTEIKVHFTHKNDLKTSMNCNIHAKVIFTLDSRYVQLIFDDKTRNVTTWMRQVGYPPSHKKELIALFLFIGVAYLLFEKLF